MEDEELRRITNTFLPVFTKHGISSSFIDCAYCHYRELSENYDIQGDVELWMSCALYEQYKGTSEFGALFLDQILKCAQISFPDFFNKMKNWMEMSGSLSVFREHILALEQNFNVNMVLFCKYRSIFSDLFALNSTVSCHLSAGISLDELFEFIWLLHIRIKASLSGIREDLVNCYQLLICCVDLVYTNVVQCNRQDLLNLQFPGIPLQYLTESPLGQKGLLRHQEDADLIPSIIESVCLRHDGLLKECLAIKQHWFRPHVVNLAMEGALTLNPSTLVSFFSHRENYSQNRNYLDTSYELMIQKSGQLDERLFVRECSEGENSTLLYSSVLKHHVETSRDNRPMGCSSSSYVPKSSPTVVNEGQGVAHLSCDLSLTGSASFGSAVQGLTRLQAILVGHGNQPPNSLMELFNECSALTAEEITMGVKFMGSLFTKQFELEVKDSMMAEQISCLVDMKLYYAETLYYKLLEEMLSSEAKRLRSNSKIFIFNILHKREFHQSLFSCCSEIVLFCYQSNKLFPWIMNVLGVKPYHFYRVIEVVIKHEPGLSRDVIKHLNWVEESVLEEYVWTADSPLWSDIQIELAENASKLSGVPRCVDVLLPNQISNAHTSAYKTRIQKLPGSDSTGAGMRLLSASGQTLVPVSAQPPRAQMENMEYANSPNSGTFVTGRPDSVGSQSQFSSNSGKITLVPINSPVPSSSALSSVEGMAAVTNTGSPSKVILTDKPKRTGAMALFFRKVYLLASVRMRELLAKLEPEAGNLQTPQTSNEESAELKKIWSVFENCLVLNTEILLNRHLDQILLSTCYLMGKVLDKNWTFEVILRAYRLQPQAKSAVYRQVLLTYSQTPNGDLIDHRGDIICFYNQVFLTTCLEYAQQYAPVAVASAMGGAAEVGGSSLGGGDNIGMKKPCLDRNQCVLPWHKGKPLAARKLSTNHNLYIMPHRAEEDKSSFANSAGSSANVLSYRFSISPSKNLTDINSYIRSVEVSRRRNLNPSVTSSC